MSTIATDGKIAYMYDEGSDTWHAFSASVNTAASYEWFGNNTYLNTVVFNDVVRARAGINNFQDPASRDSVITSPTNGVVCFVRQTNAGEVINQVQYYSNGRWRSIADGYVNVDTKINNYTLELKDAGRAILVDSSSARTVTIPTNATQPFAIGQIVDIVRFGLGEVTITPANGVILNSEEGQSGARVVRGRYSSIRLMKTGSDTWLLTASANPRKTTVSSEFPSGGSDGDLWFRP